MTRPLRIIGITSALLAAVSALGWRAAQHDAPPKPPAPEPWVPLPRTGMDASEHELRYQLSAQGNNDFSTACGAPTDMAPPDRYRLRIAQDAWGKGARDIVIEVDGPDALRVTVTSDAEPPAPPPPIPGEEATQTDVVPAQRRFTTVRLQRAELAPLRDAWRGSAAWHGPQQGSCKDGRPLLMEACVAGRYGRRNATCDDGDTHPAMWDAVTTLLPPPE